MVDEQEQGRRHCDAALKMYGATVQPTSYYKPLSTHFCKIHSIRRNLSAENISEENKIIISHDMYKQIKTTNLSTSVK